MNEQMDTIQALFRDGTLFLVGILGSILGYISRTWGAEKAIRYSRLGFSVLAAVFMVMLLRALCTTLALSDEWTIIIVGFCSWMGTEATVVLLEKLIHRQLGISHVYIKTDSTQSRVCSNLKPGGVYTMEQLQGSEREGGETASTADSNPDTSAS